MRAETYIEDKIDVKDWLISEKLDGLRGCWTGKKMYSRNKK